MIAPQGLLRASDKLNAQANQCPNIQACQLMSFSHDSLDHQGQDFIVVSAEDWEREQETLYILQNQDLMQQIAHSMETHSKQQGYPPSSGEMDELLSV